MIQVMMANRWHWAGALVGTIYDHETSDVSFINTSNDDDNKVIT